MINIYIPYRDVSSSVNLSLFLLTKRHPEWFEFKTNIESIYGSFPRCRWNGGRYLSGSEASEEVVAATIDLYNSIGIRFRLTFTNSFVTEKHLYDAYANMILDIASDSGINEVLVNNNVIENYIKNKYTGKFEFIQSVTKCIRDVADINESCKKYKLVVIDYRDGRDDSFLNSIEDKSKSEIMLNDTCNFYCSQRFEHHQDVQRLLLACGDIDEAYKIGYRSIVCPYNIHYSGKKSTKDFIEYIERDEVGALTKERFKEVYELGFRNFKFVGREMEPHVLAMNYTYYLAKEEYREDFYNELTNRVITDVISELEEYYLY